MQLTKALSTLLFKNILKSVLIKIKRGSFQKPDSYGIIEKGFGYI